LGEKRGKIRYEEKGGFSGQPQHSVDPGVGSISFLLYYIQTSDVGGKEAEVGYAVCVLVPVLAQVFRGKRLGRGGYICRRALPDGVWIFLGTYRNGKASRRCGLG